MNNPLMVSLDPSNSMRFLRAFPPDSQDSWIEFEPARDYRIVGAKYLRLHIADSETAHEIVLREDGTWFVRTPVDAS